MEKDKTATREGKHGKKEIKKNQESFPVINKPRQRVRTALLLIWVIILPITLFYFSPYIPFMGIVQGVITGSIIIFAGQFISSLIFGRLFCGWLCPVGGLQDFASAARPKRLNRKKLQWVKFILWVPWIAAWIALALNAVGIKTTIPKIDMFFAMEWGISVSRPEAYITYLFVLTVILILSFAVGRRAFCHTLCWMAPFMVLGQKLGKLIRIPGLNLKFKAEKCSGCGQCNVVCPMSIDIAEMINKQKINKQKINKQKINKQKINKQKINKQTKNSLRHHDCTYCMRCSDICPNSVIKLTLR